MLTQYINAKFPSDGKRGTTYQVFFRRVKETNKTTNLQARFFYNAVLYCLTDLPIASVLLPRIFPANERVCLNMHCLCFVDNWLLGLAPSDIRKLVFYATNIALIIYCTITCSTLRGQPFQSMTTCVHGQHNYVHTYMSRSCCV